MILTDWFAEGARREFKGKGKLAVDALCGAVAFYHIYIFSTGAFEVFVHRSIHVGSILAVCFLTFSFSAKDKDKFLWFDIFLALIALGITAYLVSDMNNLVYERVMLETGSLANWQFVMGGIFILMVFEAARRAMGHSLGIITMLIMLFAYFGPQLGGVLHHSGYSVKQIIDFSVFSERGLFSLPIGVCSTYIIMFLIFAGLIERSGAGEFFSELALGLAGRAKGGAAKVAVIGSALMGMITGSSAANVAITGSITIPMMKKAGFEPYFAAAVESAAGNGGLIMPPVMAGTAFLMAEFAGVTYWTVCVAAFIPACLYFLGIYFQVHFYASRYNIAAAEESVIPPVWKTLKKGWQYFIPFVVLITLLSQGYSPIWAGLWSFPVVIAISWFKKGTRIGFKKFFEGLTVSVKAIRLIMLACALSGIIMEVIMFTGMGTRLVSALVVLSKSALIITLFVSAAVCMVLGLSLSLVASYILTAILVVPAAVTLGVAPLAAHLFAFYFASLSAITPPVGATFFQAAAMAGAPPFKTGWAATRLAIAAFIVPFLFVYYPGLLLVGGVGQIILAVVVATLVICCLAIGLEGWFLGKMDILQRGLIIVAGLMLVVIKPVTLIISVLLMVFVIFRHWRDRKLLAGVQQV